MDVRFSTLVRQYPLDQEAYNYWLTVQKNSQSLGGLFDLQPSQIRGNIHGVTNPNDVVRIHISFIGARRPGSLLTIAIYPDGNQIQM